MNTTALVLATSETYKESAPYVFSDDVPKYPLLRDSIKVYMWKDATERIAQIKLIDLIVSGHGDKGADIISDTIAIDNAIVVSGEDFYVALIDGKMETFIIESRRNDKRTLIEVEYVQNHFVDYLNDKRGLL